jgi:spore coat protein A
MHSHPRLRIVCAVNDTSEGVTMGAASEDGAADRAGGLTRRRLLQLVTVAGVAYAVPVRWAPRAYAAASPQTLMPASQIPQFLDPLPSLETIPAGSDPLELVMSEFRSRVLPSVGWPGAASYGGTWAWGYRMPGDTTTERSYLGPVIVATRGVPTQIKWVNELGGAASTKVAAYKYGTDQTLHWADPLGNEANEFAHLAGFPAYGSAAAQNYDGPVPACVHLHGGEVPPELDGGPDAWFTSDGAHHGHAFYSKDGAAANYSIYRYPNTQEAAAIWFHDHALGVTRLNVFAGLAGGYLIEEPGLLPASLPGAVDIIPLVLQDRSFDVNGQFFLPADSAGGVLWSPNPEHPYWVPEFTGEVIVVNGKAWPWKSVQRRRHRFLFVNGSNARVYEMFLTDPVTKVDGPPMWVIATDGGYLDAPVKIDPAAPSGSPRRLVIMPGERYQVIIDFNDPDWRARNPNFSGTLLLRNVAKVPYPAGATAQGSTSGRIMQFRVQPGTVTDTSYDPRGGTPLRPSRPLVRLVTAATGTLAAGVTVDATRQLTLNEILGPPQTVTDPVTGVPNTAYPGGPLEILVNNTKWTGRRVNGVQNGMYTFETRTDFTPAGIGNEDVSELPAEGSTEIWEIVNLTVDAHPIHLHLAQFQVLNRQAFNTKSYAAAYAAAFPGGGWDLAAGKAYPPGVFIPGWGPPLRYDTGNPRALGGNPDITPHLQGKPRPPERAETGWKDTVTTLPGEVTRFVVRWGPTDVPVGQPATYPFSPNDDHGYVWHCHIIDHEDNEMMRPTLITPKQGATRTYVKGIDY